LWVLAVARHPLLSANAVSALRYLLICVAAWGLFGERVSAGQCLGMALIAAGIVLVK
jgi:drug/metabolite transporter (DMT)-like permease